MEETSESMFNCQSTTWKALMPNTSGLSALATAFGLFLFSHHGKDEINAPLFQNKSYLPHCIGNCSTYTRTACGGRYSSTSSGAFHFSKTVYCARLLRAHAQRIMNTEICQNLYFFLWNFAKKYIYIIVFRTFLAKTKNA